MPLMVLSNSAFGAYQVGITQQVSYPWQTATSASLSGVSSSQQLFGKANSMNQLQSRRLQVASRARQPVAVFDLLSHGLGTLASSSSLEIPEIVQALSMRAASSANMASSMYIDALHTNYFATTATQAFLLVAAGDYLAQRIESGRSASRTVDTLPEISLRCSQAEGGPESALDMQLSERVSAETGVGGSKKIASTFWDPLRTLRMGCLGMVIGGFGTATWLRFLEDMLPASGSYDYSAFGNLPAWFYAPLLRTFAETDVDLLTVSDSYLVVVKAILDACIWAPIANGLYLVLTPLSEGKSVKEAKTALEESFFDVMKTEVSTFLPYNLVSFSLVPPLVRPFTTGFISMCFAVYISWITHRDGSGGAGHSGPSDFNGAPEPVPGETVRDMVRGQAAYAGRPSPATMLLSSNDDEVDQQWTVTAQSRAEDMYANATR